MLKKSYHRHFLRVGSADRYVGQGQPLSYEPWEFIQFHIIGQKNIFRRRINFCLQIIWRCQVSVLSSDWQSNHVNTPPYY